MSKTLYSRLEMQRLNIQALRNRGVDVKEIAKIAYDQQKKYNADITEKDCLESVYKILSLRNTFHSLQLSIEIDRLVEEKAFKGPIQEILMKDTGVFGVDEIIGLSISGMYGAIGETNFGDIDVNKPGIVNELNELGKQEGICHTFLDDVVGAIAAAASTRVAQIETEKQAQLGYEEEDIITIFDIDTI